MPLPAPELLQAPTQECILPYKVTHNSMSSSGNVCQAEEGERLSYYISFITTYVLT